MQFKQQLISSTNLANPGVNPARYVTVHETGNSSVGADAQAHADLQSRGNPAGASWHYQVDDWEAIQSFPHSIKCWHAGDGYGLGNEQSIGVETCVNADGDWEQTKANLIDLLVQICQDESIPAARVGQHYDRSGKNCPQRLRSNGGEQWRYVMEEVGKRLNGATSPQQPSPSSKTIEQLAAEVYAGNWGNDPERSQRLAAAGHDAAQVQTAVNRIYYGIQ